MDAGKTYRLRSARELIEEREACKRAAEERPHEEGLARAAKLIDEAHRKGQHHVTDQTFSDFVVDKLKSLGYRVRFYRAAHSGDVDCHEIEWD